MSFAAAAARDELPKHRAPMFRQWKLLSRAKHMHSTAVVSPRIVCSVLEPTGRRRAFMRSARPALFRRYRMHVSTDELPPVGRSGGRQSPA